jgi:hypothetical protein
MPSTQIEGIEMMGCQEVAQAPLLYSFNLDAIFLPAIGSVASIAFLI